MKLTILIMVLMLPLSFTQADEESLRIEIDNLRRQLIADQNRIAQLETLTSLLMAAYQLEETEALEAYKKKVFPNQEAK